MGRSIMTTSSVTLKAKDYGSEATRLGFHITQLTSANFVAQLALVDTLQTAIDNVALGNFSGKQVSAVDIAVGPKATDVNAQREAKWRVIYEDAVNPIGNGSFEIGMADLQFLVAGTGKMDISAGAGAALVTAIEAAVISRLENAITVTEVLHVGRNI